MTTDAPTKVTSTATTTGEKIQSVQETMSPTGKSTFSPALATVGFSD
ncbi:hypothetical protein [Streptomyces botrytidirepellens]|nr:hypothetical protein [Streptomyces botrytidirepellens]